MSLLTMCISLMQEQLVEKCRWLSKEIGLSKGSETEVEDTSDKNKKKDDKKADPLSDPFKLPPPNTKKPDRPVTPLPGELENMQL